MKSKHTKIFLATMWIIPTFICTLAIFLKNWEAALFIALCGMICFLLSTIYCLYTAKQIKQLSQYLASVYRGGEILDIRTQQEGELNALRDDIYKITTILSEQKDALLREKNRLADFLGDIAHQLKTPLSAILLQTELWEDALVPESQKAQCAQQTAKSAQKMQWLVEQLLNLCRLDAAVVKFHYSDYFADYLVKSALQGLESTARKQDILLEFHGDFSQKITCDAPWIIQALSNLIKNAIEHTPQQGVIQVRFSQSMLYSQFEVCNSGNPIAKADMPHLFERFWKGNPSETNSVGIGLSLAKAIVEGQKGRLWAENTTQGPCFILQLPRSDQTVTTLSPCSHLE